MKSSKNLCKRLFCILLVLSAMVALSVTASADAWIPPTDKYYNEDVYYILGEESGRRTVNLFLSNFSEANLLTYDTANTSDSDVLKILFKHFELNAPNYSGVTVGSDGDNGKIMTVTQGTIEKAAKNMFNRTFTRHPIAGFKGYKDGNYIVTANRAGSPLKVLSVASYIEYYGDNVYEASFAIYKTEADIDSYYSYQSSIAYDAPELKMLGEGYAKFNYVGGSGATAFRLVSYRLNDIDKTGLLYTGPNEPVVPAVSTTTAAKTTVPSTTPSTIVSTPETTVVQTQTETQTSAAETQVVICDKAVINEVKDKADFDRLIYITVFVVVIAVAATVIIFVVYRKKKGKDAE